MSSSTDYTLNDISGAATAPRRRSKDFKGVNASSPAEARDAFVAVRTMLRTVKAAQAKAAPLLAKARADRDLTDAGRARKLLGIAEAYRQEVEPAAAAAKVAVRDGSAKLRAAIDAGALVDPMRELDVQNGKSPEAREMRTLSNRIGALARLQARQEIDRQLDRALAVDDPAPLLRAIETLGRDPALAHTLLTHGRERIEAEASPAARGVAEAAFEAIRENRVNADPELALLADHADAVTGLAPFVEAIEADVLSEEFVETGKSVALETARQFLDPGLFE